MYKNSSHRFNSGSCCVISPFCSERSADSAGFADSAGSADFLTALAACSDFLP